MQIIPDSNQRTNSKATRLQEQRLKQAPVNNKILVKKSFVQKLQAQSKQTTDK